MSSYPVIGMSKVLAAMFLLPFVTVPVSAATDLEAGLAAYKAKKYDVAMTELTSGDAVGNAKAQERVANMYRKGRGVQKDKLEAAKWYRLAAAQGFDKAQYELGMMLNTMGGKRKYSLSGSKLVSGGYKYSSKGDYSLEPEAWKWMQVAASKGGMLGNPLAKVAREDMELDMKGMSQLLGERLIYDFTGNQRMVELNSRADGGDQMAQYELGMIYMKGDGVRKNKTLAFHWLDLAWHNGVEKAKKPRKSMCKKLKKENDERLGSFDSRYMLVEYFEAYPHAFVEPETQDMLKASCR